MPRQLIFKHPRSSFWYARIKNPTGKWVNKSTGKTNAKEAADEARRLEKEYEHARRTNNQSYAELVENFFQKAKRGAIDDRDARLAIAEAYKISTGLKLPAATAKEFFTRWIDNKFKEVSPSTAKRYQELTERFVLFLGEKASQELALITKADVSAFRDAISKDLSTGTVNLTVKVLRSAFSDAWRDGLVQDNPAKRIKLSKGRRDAIERRPFTLPELKRILTAANDEWKGLITFGLLTGQRLGDLATLTWQNIHEWETDAPELRFATDKTGRRQSIPLSSPLIAYLETIAGDNPRAPLFPEAYKIASKGDTGGRLSKQFYDILVAAGLAKERSTAKQKDGRSARRELSEISFHSLRHTATTLLKAAGVSDALAQEFVGHNSKAMSVHYTHIESAQMRTAANKLAKKFSGLLK